MRARFVVRGRVQGVYYRVTAADHARMLDLTGRVWNRDDGSVELVAEGSAEALGQLEGWLQRGPSLADVSEVERTDLDGDVRYSSFGVSRGPAE